jgi:hypothetical protein
VSHLPALSPLPLIRRNGHPYILFTVRSRLGVSIAAALSAWACRGESVAPTPAAATLTLSTTSLEDTIGVTLLSPISLRVLRGAVPQTGLAVRMTVGGSGNLASLAASATGAFAATLPATTDATGTANAFVTFALTAGSGTIAIEIPSLALRDSVRFVVRAGKLAQVSVAPRDTAVFVGRPLKLRVELRDRGGNVVADRLDVSSISGLAPTTASDVFLAGPDVARGFVALRSPLRTDTIAVSIVPVDTMLFTWWTISPCCALRLASAGLDGTVARTFGPSSFEGPLLHPGWSADGNRVVANYGGSYGDERFVARLYFYDTTTTRTELAAYIPGFHERVDAHFSRAGDWIYFHSIATDYSTGVWRIRPDGTGLEALITRTLVDYIYDVYPFPDGKSVIITKGQTPTTHGFRLDVITHALQDLGAMESPLSISPDGTQIAWVGVLDGNLWMRDVSGGAPRLVSAGVGSVGVPPAWTRDGRYVVIASFVINVATGARVQLPWIVASPKTLSVRDPSARP